MSQQVGKLVGTEGENDPPDKRRERIGPQVANQQICPVRREGKRDENDKVVRCHKADECLQRDAQESVERHQGVKDKTDPLRVEEVIGPEWVRMKLGEGLPDPPEIPDEDVAVESISGKVCREAEGKGIGKEKGEECICSEDAEVLQKCPWLRMH